MTIAFVIVDVATGRFGIGISQSGSSFMQSMWQCDQERVGWMDGWRNCIKECTEEKTILALATGVVRIWDRTTLVMMVGPGQG